eukprot:3753497-Rhodomonas_salina.1
MFATATDQVHSHSIVERTPSSLPSVIERIPSALLCVVPRIRAALPGADARYAAARRSCKCCRRSRVAGTTSGTAVLSSPTRPGTSVLYGYQRLVRRAVPVLTHSTNARFHACEPYWVLT